MLQTVENFAHVLGIHCVTVWWWMELNPSGNWSGAVFPRGQCWGPSCWISLMMVLSAPSVTLQVTPSWREISICLRVTLLGSIWKVVASHLSMLQLCWSYSVSCSGLVPGPRSCLMCLKPFLELYWELLLNFLQIKCGLLSWDCFSQRMNQLQVFMADYPSVIVFHGNKVMPSPSFKTQMVFLLVPLF